MSQQVPPERRRDMSLKEVAYELSVSPWWVRVRLGSEEVPPHFRRGTFIYFPRDKFIEWQKRQEANGSG